MNQDRYFVLSVIAIFIVTFAGAYFSPTFEEQQTYLELFFLFGATLFVFSILVIFVAIGFTSFALYMALFLAVVTMAFGIEGALLVSGMSYFFWGSVFAMEVLLFYNSVVIAQEWFEQRYTFASFQKEYYAFYPMMLFLYLLLEFVPHFFYREKLLKFSPRKVLQAMQKILKPH